MAVTKVVSQAPCAPENHASSPLGCAGLQFEPFKSDGQVLSFCDLADLTQLIAQVREDLTTPHKLPIVMGDSGMGKTTIMRHIATARHCRAIMIQASPGLTACNILKRFAEAAALPLPNRQDAPVDQAEQLLAEMASQSITLTIMVDDADRLPLQTLAILIHCLAKQVEGASRTIEVVLFGQASIVAQAQSLTLGGDQGIQIVAHALQPLKQDDIAHYCFTRLRAAGWQGMMPAISKQTIAAIMIDSEGVPSRINAIVHRDHFPGWVSDKLAGHQRQIAINRVPEARNRFVRCFSCLGLGSLMAWMTIAPAWAIQYGSWVQACATVSSEYVSVSDFFVDKLAHVLV